MSTSVKESESTAGLDPWALLDAFGEGLCVVDARGILVWRNAAVRRRDVHDDFRPGIDVFRTAGRAFVPGPDLDAALRGLDEVLRGRIQRFRGDCPYRGLRSERWASIAIDPCRVGGRRAVLLRLRDVTAHRAADVAVHESEARWRRLVDGSPDVVFLTDASSRMIYANRALEERTGYTAADFQMRQPENPFIHPDDQGRVAAFLADFVASDRTLSDRIENRFLTRDGEVLWCASVVSKTEYLGHPALQFVVHDVSAEHAAREESARLLEEARVAVRARNEFLSLAAHELKTPVTGLRGYVQWLVGARSDDPKRLGRALSAIERQSARLTRLVERLLDVTRLETKGLALERRPVDLVAVVRDALAAIDRPHRTLIEVDAPPSLPLVGDPLRLGQVVTNLVENALTFGPGEGPVHLSARELGPDLVELTVTDHGPGLPPELRANVFDPFAKGPESGHGGLGLGLHIAREIVQLHGGTISAETADGGGARFRVTLPAGGGQREAG